jgi:hypothetical protein
VANALQNAAAAFPTWGDAPPLMRLDMLTTCSENLSTETGHGRRREIQRYDAYVFAPTIPNLSKNANRQLYQEFLTASEAAQRLKY